MRTLSVPIVLDRRFQFWSYQVSHSVALLRSGIAPGADTRVDLMFRAVRTLQLKQRYDSLVVDVVPTEEALRMFGLEERETDGRYVFSLMDGRGRGGYIVAGSLFLTEDDLSEFEPSSIDHREQAGRIIRELEYS
ncbi:hypothetical protein Ade02nite_23960 [Paractinoplanes deccanensis]|uniref:Uncharacterized protein n=1 Tax=Paractinoplanes deccanensis TaxID=113561 RepID=A0ABQ3Y1M1_9ACTN|nr:hypothetical protein Ade02nite_23960 [Actinoplanes deccanensis]